MKNVRQSLLGLIVASGLINCSTNPNTESAPNPVCVCDTTPTPDVARTKKDALILKKDKLIDEIEKEAWPMIQPFLKGVSVDKFKSNFKDFCSLLESNGITETKFKLQGIKRLLIFSSYALPDNFEAMVYSFVINGATNTQSEIGDYLLKLNITGRREAIAEARECTVKDVEDLEKQLHDSFNRSAGGNLQECPPLLEQLTERRGKVKQYDSILESVDSTKIWVNVLEKLLGKLGELFRTIKEIRELS